MSLDHALATHLGAGDAVLRLYGWARPTVSFGRNEPSRGRYDAAAAAERGVDFVRRPTGGRAVLHDAEVTYTVVAHAAALDGPRAAYRSINRALAAALASLGVPAELSTAKEVAPLDAGPCFQTPAEGEVTAGGRKLVGSAQARIDGVLLQHGSILLSGDQSLLEELRTAPRETGGARSSPATLDAFVPGVGVDEVRDAVARHMQKTFDGSWRTDEYRREELATAARLEEERYGTDDWTWRR